MVNIVNLKRIFRKNIIIDGCVRKYYKVKHKRNVAKLQKYGYDINREIVTILREKIEFCVWAGTLLGVVRDNGFIKGDDDLDYCINVKTRDGWNLLYKSLTEAGYHLKHFFVYNGTITEMAFSKYGLGIDFFGLQPFGERTSVIIFYRDSGEEYDLSEASCIRICLNPYTKLIEKDINNSKFILPDNYEEFLVSNYGEDWMIPQSITYTEALGERLFMPKEHGRIRYHWS